MERQEDRILFLGLYELDLFRCPVSRDVGLSVMVGVRVDLCEEADESETTRERRSQLRSSFRSIRHKLESERRSPVA